MAERDNGRDGIVLLAIAVEGGLVLVALLLGWLLTQPPLSHFTLELRAVLWGLGAAIPMLLAALVLLHLPLRSLQNLRVWSDTVLRPLLVPCTTIDLLGISCLAGLGEEMVFRGVFQDALAEHLPPVGAIAVAAVLFGLLHAVSLSYALLAAGMGAYLGWLYVATDNLLAPMVTHAAYDFVMLVHLLRGSDENEGEGEGEEDEEDDEEP